MFNIVVFVLSVVAWMVLLISSLRYRRDIKDLQMRVHLHGTQIRILNEMMQLLREKQGKVEEKVETWSELTSSILERVNHEDDEPVPL